MVKIENVEIRGSRMSSVLLMEPASSDKRRHLSDILTGQQRLERFSLAETKNRLKEIRDYSTTHSDILLDQLIARRPHSSDIEVTLAADVSEALQAIRTISEGTRIAVGKSAVVAKELVPALTASGFDVIDTYYDQFKSSESIHDSPNAIPRTNLHYVSESFFCSGDLNRLRLEKARDRGSKAITGLLGVNAVSAQEGSIVLLQHMHNIGEILDEAKELIFVVGIDKLVRSAEDAMFQAKCMAMFGWEALLPISVDKAQYGESLADMPFEVPPEETSKKIHIIVFDNGRKKILKSRYRDLMTCIGCRACVNNCPASSFFEGGGGMSPKEYLFFFLTGANPSLDLCLQCRSCQIRCPLDIDIPGMILEARSETITRRRRPLSDSFFSHFETMAKMGSSLPFLPGMAARSRFLRMLGEKIIGLSREREIPKLQRTTFEKWFRSTADKNK